VPQRLTHLLRTLCLAGMALFPPAVLAQGADASAPGPEAAAPEPAAPEPVSAPEAPPAEAAPLVPAAPPGPSPLARPPEQVIITAPWASTAGGNSAIPARHSVRSR
jgi:hypothetical protein